MTYPRTFSHIGLSVTDLDKAVDFYTKVLGWYVIMPPTEIVSDNSAIGVMCDDVFGEGWGSFRIAHLSTGDKIGVEIFFIVVFKKYSMNSELLFIMIKSQQFLYKGRELLKADDSIRGIFSFHTDRFK